MQLVLIFCNCSVKRDKSFILLCVPSAVCVSVCFVVSVMQQDCHFDALWEYILPSSTIWLYQGSGLCNISVTKRGELKNLKCYICALRPFKGVLFFFIAIYNKILFAAVFLFFIFAVVL